MLAMTIPGALLFSLEQAGGRTHSLAPNQPIDLNFLRFNPWRPLLKLHEATRKAFL